MEYEASNGSDGDRSSEHTFKASAGWRHRFKARRGIRQLSCQGELLSAQSENVEPFKTRLARLIEEGGYSKHPVFNSDETGLNWRILQNITLVDGTEKHARGFKLPKYRVTLLATANASGDFHLPMVLIHKYLNPRVLKHSNSDSLRVDYYAQKKTWMDSTIFTKWFKSKFVPRTESLKVYLLKPCF